MPMPSQTLQSSYLQSTISSRDSSNSCYCNACATLSCGKGTCRNWQQTPCRTVTTCSLIGAVSANLTWLLCGRAWALIVVAQFCMFARLARKGTSMGQCDVTERLQFPHLTPDYVSPGLNQGEIWIVLEEIDGSSHEMTYQGSVVSVACNLKQASSNPSSSALSKRLEQSMDWMRTDQAQVDHRLCFRGTR